MKHIFSINIFSLLRINPHLDPPPCTDPPACICSGEATMVVYSGDPANPDGCGCGESDNLNPACDSPMFSCDADICKPEDKCTTPSGTPDLPCCRLDKCGIDWSWCFTEDRCDSDNPCGPSDTEGQPIP